MPKNMTISIPDSLFNALKGVKGEVPISRTCAIALQNAIDSVNTYAMKAKVRFACFSLGEAERMAFDVGMKWAAEEAPIEHIIFVALFNDGDELERYAEFNEGLRALITAYADDDSLAEYWREEVQQILPSHITSRFSDDNIECMDIASSFFHGIKTIWNQIAPFANSEVDGDSQAYIFPALKG